MLIASKVQETVKKIKYILHSAFILSNPQYEGQEIDNAILEAHRKAIVSYERVILEAIGFNFDRELAFEILVKFAKHLSVESSAQTLKNAWKILQEAYYSTVCLQFHPAIMAICALRLAEKTNEELIERMRNFANGYLGIPHKILKEAKEELRKNTKNVEDRIKCK